MDIQTTAADKNVVPGLVNSGSIPLLHFSLASLICNLDGQERNVTK
jgi:hypothetical protein